MRGTRKTILVVPEVICSMTTILQQEVTMTLFQNVKIAIWKKTCYQNKRAIIGKNSQRRRKNVICHNTIKPAHAVTCIKHSPFSCPVIGNFIWIEPLLRGHMSYNATLFFSKM
jgi:hypothetical protein